MSKRTAAYFTKALSNPAHLFLKDRNDPDFSIVLDADRARLFAEAPAMLDFIVDSMPEHCDCDSSENYQCRRCQAELIIARVEGQS